MKIPLTALASKLLRKTSFPALDAEHVPELSSLPSEEISSDEESVARRREKYRTKEDEDVAVFLEISKKLSTKSLIFLLQNHARSMHNIPEAELNAALQRRAEQAERDEAASKPQAIRKVKQFRFAQVANDKVRAVIHEIPRNDQDELEASVCWWNQADYSAIRLEAAQLARFYRKHEPDFLDSVAVLADPGASPDAVETNMKAMMQNLNTRGLEAHMARTLSAPRKLAVRAVLEQQEICNKDTSGAVPYDVSCECLRQASLEQSASNRCFARRMGEYDQIEALKASLSRWRINRNVPQQPSAARAAVRVAAVHKLSQEPLF